MYLVTDRGLIACLEAEAAGAWGIAFFLYFLYRYFGKWWKLWHGSRP